MNIDSLLQDGWQRLQSLPQDPRGSISIGKMTSNAQCLALIYPINAQRSMSFNNDQEIIDGIYESLSDNQALIEVKGGCKADGGKYIYSIVKTLRDDYGVQYCLKADIETSIGLLEVHAFFEETGTTGIRDAIIRELAIRECSEEEFQWTFDPYDKNSQRRYLMNLSELEQYDIMFPEHPLSQARHMIHLLCSEKSKKHTKKVEQQQVDYKQIALNKARQQVKDFIAEHLNGDINALINYDFRQLESDERYGETRVYASDIYHTDIVRAIATIIFEDIAPQEVMFDRKRGTLILAPSPVITDDLWGNQIDDHFVMLSILKFCPNRKGLSERIIPCATLCNTIGNLYLQPYSLVDYRHSHSFGRFLSDHMLSDLYNTLVIEKGGSRRMKNAVLEAKKFFEPYHGTNGWKNLMEKWLMDGLVDYYLHPEPFFEEFTLNADIPTDVYFKALDQCLEMCYEIIPNRAQRMVQLLKDKLGSW